jgi:uncharacterized cysteine cluster protein YcgN (CxxCxxCC family)
MKRKIIKIDYDLCDGCGLCCSGLTALARQALADSGKEIPFRETVITVRGEKQGEN